ncbi:MAG: patatin-like phospholipase family protein, partial [Bacteroidota bacterium]
NPAVGLNYDTIQPPYTIDHLLEIHNARKIARDHERMTLILENWKKKQSYEMKPKLLFVCASGGGQRAALWTLNALLHADSILNQSLMDRTFMITGASGGLIGAAYHRELAFRKKNNIEAISSKTALTNISKDNLNAVIFTLLSNDLLLKLNKHTFQDRSYRKDRGFAFEQNLNDNLGEVFRTLLDDYRIDEESGDIPLLLMSPTIANDGRRLLLSTQSFSFLANNQDDNSALVAVDYQTLFQDLQPGDLSFLAALRMSASFPYITPNVSLPTVPRTEIMDAGISDNFGIADAVSFIYEFRDWIDENTSGVVLLTVRDTKSNREIEPLSTPSIVDRITYPVASVYNNLINMQDNRNQRKLGQLRSHLRKNLELIELSYDSDPDQNQTTRASLSWHLTASEKRNILSNIKLEENQRQLKRLDSLMTP